IEIRTTGLIIILETSPHDGVVPADRDALAELVLDVPVAGHDPLLLGPRVAGPEEDVRRSIGQELITSRRIMVLVRSPHDGGVPAYGLALAGRVLDVPVAGLARLRLGPRVAAPAADVSRTSGMEFRTSGRIMVLVPSPHDGVVPADRHAGAELVPEGPVIGH